MTQTKLTSGQKWLVAVLMAASLALAAMSFLVMFQAVRDAMEPFFGGLAWAVPIGTDTGLLITSALDVLFEVLGMRCRWLRWVAAVFIGLQLGLNVGAAHGSPIGSAGHATLPVLFVTILEAWRFFFRKRRNLVKKSDRDRIPLARWSAAPGRTWALRRLMVLWNILDYAEALTMLGQIELAQATLSRVYGRSWRHEADPDLLMKLHMAQFTAEACAAIQKLGTAASKRDDAPRDKSRGSIPKGMTTDCCEVHRKVAAKETLEMTDETIRAVNAEHLRMHGTTVGAEPLRKLFRIGQKPSRDLRNRLAESGRQVGLVGLPGPGSVGVGHGAPVGSVNGSSGGQ